MMIELEPSFWNRTGRLNDKSSRNMKWPSVRSMFRVLGMYNFASEEEGADHTQKLMKSNQSNQA